MDSVTCARIRGLPAFAELERQRRLLGWGLAILVIVLYGAFLVLVAYGKAVAARPIGDGPLTLAFPLGLGMILFAIVVTGTYAVRANALDRLVEQIRRDAAAMPDAGR